MIFVGIERHLPIRSSATAIGLIYAYISIQIRYTMAMCQLSVVSVIGSLVFEARIKMFDSCRKWLSRKRCDICVFVNMPVYSYRPYQSHNRFKYTILFHFPVD